jgi:uncharacterized protein YndB with AHSA1/START domain
VFDAARGVPRPDRSVTARRRYAVAPELVFRAFTEPALITRWFSPDPQIANEVLDYTLCVGGRYRFGYRFPDGSRTTVAGEFREILPPRRLVFTWTWEPPDPHAGLETLVTVELLESGRGTEVVITHEWFPTASARDQHEAGWRATLDRLEEVLA